MLGLGARDAFALAQAVKLLGVLIQARELRGIDDLRAVQVQMQLLRLGADLLLVAQQDGEGDLLVQQDLAGAQDLALFAFGEDDALGRPLRLVDHAAHHFVGPAQAALQLFAVLLDVDRPLRHAGIHGGLRHRGGFPNQHARIEGLGNDVLAAELEALHVVGAQHGIGHVFLGQGGQRAGGGQHHFIVDGGGAHVQRAAENEREPQHVVHLVGVVRAAGGHDGIRAAWPSRHRRRFRGRGWPARR